MHQGHLWVVGRRVCSGFDLVSFPTALASLRRENFQLTIVSDRSGAYQKPQSLILAVLPRRLIRSVCNRRNLEHPRFSAPLATLTGRRAELHLQNGR